jgi:hypothetical protein
MIPWTSLEQNARESLSRSIKTSFALMRGGDLIHITDIQKRGRHQSEQTAWNVLLRKARELFGMLRIRLPKPKRHYESLH